MKTTHWTKPQDSIFNQKSANHTKFNRVTLSQFSLPSCECSSSRVLLGPQCKMTATLWYPQGLAVLIKINCRFLNFCLFHFKGVISQDHMPKKAAFPYVLFVAAFLTFIINFFHTASLRWIRIKSWLQNGRSQKKNTGMSFPKARFPRVTQGTLENGFPVCCQMWRRE